MRALELVISTPKMEEVEINGDINAFGWEGAFFCDFMKK